jgi:hypothetical protein
MNRLQLAITLCVTIALYITACVICAKKIKTKEKASTAVEIFAFVAVALLIFFLFYPSDYYDRYGNRYSDYTQVMYYSQTGEKYIYEGDPDAYYGEAYYINISNPQDRHRDLNSFITRDGYIFFDDSGKKIKPASTDDALIYLDENGNICYGADDVDWTWTGKLDVSPWKYTIDDNIMDIGMLVLVSVQAIFVFIMFTNKKIRFADLLKKYYVLSVICFNLLFYIFFAWYVALVLSILISLGFIYVLPIDFARVSKEELEGGWGLTQKIRDRQKKEFLENPTEEKKAQIEYFRNHPVTFNRYIFFAVTNLIPIIVILTCIISGIYYI